MSKLSDALIIGAGWIAHTGYLPALERLRWSVSIFDTGKDAAGSAALTAALEHAKRNPGVLAIIATPNATHLTLAREFLDVGCQVLVEKPACLPTQADTAASRPSSDQLFVSTPFRFRPDVERFIAEVERGAVGDVTGVEMSWRRHGGIPRPGSWYTLRALAGGGVLADLGPHMLDIGMALLGWPETRVTAAETWPISAAAGGASLWMAPTEADTLPADVEVAARVGLEDARGRTLRLELSWHDDVAADATIIEATGTNGRLRLDTLLGFAPGPKEGRLSGAVTATIQLDRTPAIDFARMLDRVVDGTGSTGTQGIAVMRIIARAYEFAGAGPTPWLS